MNENIALVTGANRGIGRQIATQLAERGFTVLAGVRTPSAAEPAVDRIHQLRLDVTDPADREAAAAWIAERFGRLDVLVNNAGISGPRDGQLPSTTEPEVLREVFETNVVAVLAVTNVLLPLLRRSPAARIVNVSSGLGSLTCLSDEGSAAAGRPPFAAYAPSKTALNALTVQYAKELRADGILVNAVAPGACATDFVQGFSFAHTITRAPTEGAAVAVRLATLPPEADGPTGGFFDDKGPVPW
jgi:NAD(P)-dependent dehydrogenase (short-subunit alcohol dehydrogenase family)